MNGSSCLPGVGAVIRRLCLWNRSVLTAFFGDARSAVVPGEAVPVSGMRTESGWTICARPRIRCGVASLSGRACSSRAHLLQGAKAAARVLAGTCA